MFKQLELFKFVFDDEECFCYVILETDDFVDMSIFTMEEWNELEEMYKLFGKKGKSDMDTILYVNFGVKFKDLHKFEEYESNLRSRYEEIHWNTMDLGEKEMTKDKLRKCFVYNYNALKKLIL